MQGSWGSESPQGPENTGLMEGVTDKTKARCADKWADLSNFLDLIEPIIKK